MFLDRAIEILGFLEVLLVLSWFLLDAKSKKEPEKKPNKKKLKVHPAVKDNPELFTVLGSRVVLKKHLR